MEYIFSYGTLQKSEVQLRLFGRPLRGWEDTLEGFKTSDIEIDDERFLAGGGGRRQLTAVASSGDAISGMVFEIPSSELALTDRYEPNNYERIAVTLNSGKQAWLYLQKI